MLKIRRSFFETNSSSSHCIIFNKKQNSGKTFPTPETDYRVRFDADGELIVHMAQLEFGWGFDILTNWYERLCYAIASFQDNDTVMEKLTDICRKDLKGFKDFRFIGKYNDNLGYIDHQSIGTLQDFLFKHDVDLEEFIFNDRYIVVIDNDNTAVLNTIIETGLFDTSNVGGLSGDDDGE